MAGLRNGCLKAYFNYFTNKMEINMNKHGGGGHIYRKMHLESEYLNVNKYCIEVIIWILFVTKLRNWLNNKDLVILQKLIVN